MKKTLFIISIAVITIFSFLVYASTPVTIRSGTTRNIPATGEEDWGDEVTNWIIDATTAINASPQSQYTRKFTAVVGSSADVSAGNASHSTLASAVAFATSGGSIYVMDGTHFVTSEIVLSKPISIIGNGYKSFIVSNGAGFSTSSILNFATSGITVSQITFDTSSTTQNILKFSTSGTNAHVDVRVAGNGTSGFLNDLTGSGDNASYGHYVWGTSGKSLNTLSYLYDASITAPTTDDGLFRYNNKWVNKNIAGATNEINVTQSAGTVTIGIVDPLITSKGGTGRATIGSSNQMLGVNPTATALNYKTVSGGTGISVSAGDGWMTIVPSIIPVPNGGTNNTTIGSNQVVYGKGTFYTSDSNFSYNGTNVGIGTDLPSVKLEVSSSTAYGANVRITDATTSGSSTAGFSLYNGTTVGTQIISWSTSSSGGGYFGESSVSGQNYLVFNNRAGTIGTFGANYLKFGTDNTERMRITATGRVVISSATDLGQLLSIKGNATDVGAGIALQPYSTTNTGFLGVASAANNYITGSAADDLAIRSAGNILMGYGATEIFRAATDGKITAAGVYNNTVGATNRDVYVDNTGLLGYVSSSKRYKTNIRPFDTDTIENVIKLNPVRFDYIDPRRGLNQIGFIAEDVAKVFPEVVSYNKDGSIETVQYSKMAVILTGGIKDLYKQNVELKNRLDDLEKRIEKLEKKIK